MGGAFFRGASECGCGSCFEGWGSFPVESNGIAKQHSWLSDDDVPNADLSEEDFEQILEFLGTVPLFKVQLPRSQRPLVAKALRKTVWEPGQVVVEQGEEGKAFYLLWQGEATVMVRDAEDAEPQGRALLGPGDHWGGRTLTEKRASVARIVAKGPQELVTLSVSRGDFARLGLHKDIKYPYRPAIYEGRRVLGTAAAVPAASPYASDASDGLHEDCESDVERTPQQTALICQALKVNANLRALLGMERDMVKTVASYARLKQVRAGTEITRCGEHGNEFYIIAEGSFVVMPCGFPDSDQQRSVEDVVATSDMMKRLVRKQHFMAGMLCSKNKRGSMSQRTRSAMSYTRRRVDSPVKLEPVASDEEEQAERPERRGSLPHNGQKRSTFDSPLSLAYSRMRRGSMSGAGSHGSLRSRERHKTAEAADPCASFQLNWHSQLSLEPEEPAKPLFEEGDFVQFANPGIVANIKRVKQIGIVDEVRPAEGMETNFEVLARIPPSSKTPQRYAEEELKLLDDPPALMMLLPGESFGELSLLYNTRREATVKACEDSVVYVIGRSEFKALFTRNEKKIEDYLNILDEVPMLQQLLRAQRLELAKNATGFEHFAPEQEIIAFGGKRQAMQWYIVAEGECVVSKQLIGPDGNLQPFHKEVARVTRGGHVGEHSILKHNNISEYAVRAGPDGVTFLAIDGKFLEGLPLNHDKDGMVTVDTELNQYFAQVAIAKKAERHTSEQPNIRLAELTSLGRLGTGGFGDVMLVQFGAEKYALKRMSKGYIARQGAAQQIWAERDTLLNCDSPFIVHLLTTYRDAQYVYMLLEAALGGELYEVLASHSEVLSQDRPRGSSALFYVACIAEGLGHLHDRCVTYRDLKLENVILDAAGYAKLCDMGFARVVLGKAYTMVGTPMYLAPEMIDFPHAHDHMVDWWALGVITYELLTGQGPWDNEGFDSGGDIMAELLAIRRSQARGLDFKLVPNVAQGRIRDFVNRLLCADPSERLGSRSDIRDIRSHAWPSGQHFDFKALVSRTLDAPHVPVPVEPDSDQDECHLRGRSSARFARMPENGPDWSEGF
eukprot:TRINITY_DN121305_c0_g1_i1.p1 TRINITY_DN121305_c0_g1~~TRINITY_DN121305_c0_g1_i1.p1  ORF type:complete len:1067 (+),score=259.64 TRINITY_DN121305_c0_g1_i1:113-3313(+)